MVGVAFYKEGEYGIVLNADCIKTDDRGIINLSIYLCKDFHNRIAENSPPCAVIISEKVNDTSSLINIQVPVEQLKQLTKKEVINGSKELNRIYINIKDGQIIPTPNRYKNRKDIPTNISATVHYQNDYNKVAEYCKKQTVNNLYDFFIAGDNLVRMPQERETSAQKNKPKFRIQ